MSKFECVECGYGSPSWYGKCPSCSEWNTLQEIKEEKKKSTKVDNAKITPLSEIRVTNRGRTKTGVFEFDRVVGGGFVKGEVVLIAGQPGVGKSTLLLNILQNIRTVYISGEESGVQVKRRAERINIDVSRLSFSDSVCVESIISSLQANINAFDILVIDSVQTIYTKDVKAAAGSVSQIRESTSRLNDFAKKNDIVLLVVGHITKGGEIAGPKTLEHFVDCVLYLEGEKESQFRILRSYKNRFGPTDEVGVFEMKDMGMTQVKNPTAFLESDHGSLVGQAVVGIAEGSRSLFFEVQTLVVPTFLPVPRRVVSGLDYNKVQLLLAVLTKKLNLHLDKYDVYLSVVGGVSVKSTAADLGIAASVISAVKNSAIAPKTVFVGELGLLGEVRRVYAEDKIRKEAKRLGFKHIYTRREIREIGGIGRIIA